MVFCEFQFLRNVHNLLCFCRLMLNFPFAVQIYAEAESRTNLFVMPRREPYFRRSRISQKPRAEQIYLLCRGATVFPAKANIVRSRISQKPKVAYLARKGRVPGLYGGGEKCYGFTANRFTFPQEYNIALADAIHEIYMVQHASAIFIVE